MTRRFRARPGALLLVAALAAASGCTPGTPGTPGKPTPTAATGPATNLAAECASVQRALSDAIAETPDAELRIEATYDALMARNARLSKRGGALGARHLKMADLSYYEHGLYIGTRQRELARRAVLAECADDGSRDQSPAWKEEAFARIAALRGSLAPCFEDALAREPTRAVAMRLKIRIGADGRVVVAGPDAPYDLPGGAFTSDFAYCVVREVERTAFPQPRGEAILMIPFEHTGS